MSGKPWQQLAEFSHIWVVWGWGWGDARVAAIKGYIPQTGISKWLPCLPLAPGYSIQVESSATTLVWSWLIELNWMSLQWYHNCHNIPNEHLRVNENKHRVITFRGWTFLPPDFSDLGWLSYVEGPCSSIRVAIIYLMSISGWMKIGRVITFRSWNIFVLIPESFVQMYWEVWTWNRLFQHL